MSSPTQITKNKATEYIQTRNHYYKNAKELIGKKEFRKASEMLWGAVTQTLKALAALRGIEIRNHKEFFDITRKLAKELGDPAIYHEFAELNALHTNFYDEIIPEGAFPDFYGRAIKYIEKLQRIIHDVLKVEEKTKSNQSSAKGPQ